MIPYSQSHSNNIVETIKALQLGSKLIFLLNP